jgi:hypothetical protein
MDVKTSSCCPPLQHSPIDLRMERTVLSRNECVRLVQLNVGLQMYELFSLLFINLARVGEKWNIYSLFCLENVNEERPLGELGVDVRLMLIGY